ncbi:MAG: hypothetical protein LH472_12050 [Pyrinomonadaceae bacterium]|nr:hypothetical protein [Pyrinomonadaceae bacterium]
MKKLAASAFVLIFAVGVFAQKEEKTKPNEKDKMVMATATVLKSVTPLELAKAALAAHGGDKFKNMKTLVVIGTADVSGSPSMTFPAPFVMTYAGDKYRLEISTPFVQFKQIYDGQQTYSSAGEVSLPPINRLGLPLLPKIEEKDFTVSALPEAKKKKAGFRITSPEGFYTDFFIDEKTGQVKSYEASYEVSGRTVTTAVEIDKIREVEGVKVPERYAQRFETNGLTIYANFKAKEITVNSIINDDVFVMK